MFRVFQASSKYSKKASLKFFVVNRPRRKNSQNGDQARAACSTLATLILLNFNIFIFFRRQWKWKFFLLLFLFFLLKILFFFSTSATFFFFTMMMLFMLCIKVRVRGGKIMFNYEMRVNFMWNFFHNSCENLCVLCDCDLLQVNFSSSSFISCPTIQQK